MTRRYSTHTFHIYGRDNCVNSCNPLVLLPQSAIEHSAGRATEPVVVLDHPAPRGRWVDDSGAYATPARGRGRTSRSSAAQSTDRAAGRCQLAHQGVVPVGGSGDLLSGSERTSRRSGGPVPRL